MLGRGVERSSSLMQGAVTAGIVHSRTGKRVTADSTPVARALRGETVLDEELSVTRGSEGDELRMRVTGIPLRDEIELEMWLRDS